MTPRRLHRFHSGDLLDRVQADIDSLDRVVLAVAVPAVVAAIIGASGLTVLALIRPAFAVATGLALALALTGDLVAGRRGRRAGGELARTRAAARARLVEVLDGRMEIATYGAGPRALAELGERFGAADAPRRRWSAREGAGQLGTDLAQRKLTLPLIHSLSRLPPIDARSLRDAIRNPGADLESRVRAALKATQSIGYARRRAEEFARSARRELECLPRSECRSILEALTEWSIRREK